MPSWSRRRALHAVAATATVALAGCNASTEESGSAPRGPDGDPVNDYDAEIVRDPDGRVLFWREEDEQREREGLVLLTDPVSDSETSLDSDVPAAERLQAFAADTDFEHQSVLLYATRVSGCDSLRITGVRHGDDDVDVSLCRSPRAADVACDAAADHTAGVGVRLPFPADDVNGKGLRLSSGCREEPEPVTVDGGDGA